MAIFVVEPDDGGTISASTQADGTTVAALRTQHPTDVWSTGSAGTHTVTIDRGRTQGVSVVAALFTNMTIGGTWSFRIGTSLDKVNRANGQIPEYDSGLMRLENFNREEWIPYRHLLFVLPSTFNYRYRRFDFTDPTKGFLAGRLVLGTAWTPKVDLPDTVNLTHPEGFAQAMSGARFFQNQTALADPTLELWTRDRADFDRYAMAWSRYSREVMLCLDPEDAFYRQERIFYGLPRGRDISRGAFKYWRHRLELLTFR